MKRLLLSAILILLFLAGFSQSQVEYNRSTANTPVDYNLKVKYGFVPPRFSDTTACNTAATNGFRLDTCGAIISTYDNKLWKRDCNPKKWTEIGTGTGGTGLDNDADSLGGHPASYYAAASSVATNTTNIATNTSNIATNTTAISTKKDNSDSVATTGYTSIGKHRTDSTVLRALINTNTTNIATNTSAISTNTTNIALKKNITDSGYVNGVRAYATVGLTAKVRDSLAALIAAIVPGYTSLWMLDDVNLSSTTNNQLLKYNSGNSKWENWTPTFPTTSQNASQIHDSLQAQSVSGSIFIDTTITTTNATPLTVYSYTPTSAEGLRVEVECVANNTSTSDGFYGAKKSRKFYYSGTTLTNGILRSLDADEYIGSGLSTATFTVTNSGSNIIVQFTGEAAKSIKARFIIQLTNVTNTP